MADKIKVKPAKGQDFKEIEVSTKNWNLETRKIINNKVAPVMLEENDKLRANRMFEVGCEILDIATTLTEEEIFNLSSGEIITISFRISEEINKKK